MLQDTQTLLDIFNHKVYKIPDYQRGYSWENSHLKEFWNDLGNLPSGKHHYTGVLTIKQQSEKVYEVVDGQQRLTTIIILINEIIAVSRDKNIQKLDKNKLEYWEERFLYNEIEHDKHKCWLKYEDEDTEAYFKKEILKLDSISSYAAKDENTYTINLLKAKKFFKDRVKPMKPDALEKIFVKIIKYLSFYPYSVTDEVDVHMAFETINYRGKKPSTLEILKNRLLYLNEYANNDELRKKELHNEIVDCWKVIYKQLGKHKTVGKNKVNPKEDDFLLDHTIMYFNPKKGFKEPLLKEFTTIEYGKSDQFKKIEKDQFKKIEKYVRSLREAIGLWYCLFNPDCDEAEKKYSDAERKLMHQYNHLNFTRLRHLLLCCMMLKTRDKLSTKELLEMSTILEKFGFLYHGLLKQKITKFTNDLQDSSHNLYKGEKEFVEVVRDIKKELKDSLSRLSDPKIFYDRLTSIDKNSKKYFLFEYNEHLKKPNASNDKMFLWDDIDRTFEHIYPKTNDTKKCWIEPFQQHNEEERKQLFKSLGNLVLVKQGRNSKLSNKCFADKQKIYNRGGSFAEEEIIDIAEKEGEGDWTAEAIKERGIMLLGVLIERWGIPNTYKKDDKVRILGLDFLLPNKENP